MHINKVRQMAKKMDINTYGMKKTRLFARYNGQKTSSIVLPPKV